MLTSILFFLLSSALLKTNSQFVPLRLDLALERLRQYDDASPTSLLESLQYDGEPERMLQSLFALVSCNTANACEQDLELVFEAARNKDTWALKVLDAWGKPLPSGILKGNTYWLGNYDECIYPLYNSATKSFVSQPLPTQYCM